MLDLRTTGEIAERCLARQYRQDALGTKLGLIAFESPSIAEPALRIAVNLVESHIVAFEAEAARSRRALCVLRSELARVRRSRLRIVRGW